MSKKTCAPGKWIPCALAKHKKGSLHDMLHVPDSQKIPTPLLERVMRRKIGERMKYRGYDIPITLLLKQRTNLALVLRSF